VIYNRKRNRLAGYDYSTPGYYFVTICTKGMMEYFGRVKNSEMELNNAGRIVQERLEWLEDHFEYIKIIKSVVMPNHVHIIIRIIDDVETGRDLSDIKTVSGIKTVSDIKTVSGIKTEIDPSIRVL
jgi:REP element-mobilizing transposase RayT